MGDHVRQFTQIIVTGILILHWYPNLGCTGILILSSNKTIRTLNSCSIERQLAGNWMEKWLMAGKDIIVPY